MPGGRYFAVLSEQSGICYIRQDTGTAAGCSNLLERGAQGTDRNSAEISVQKGGGTRIASAEFGQEIKRRILGKAGE